MRGIFSSFIIIIIIHSFFPFSRCRYICKSLQLPYKQSSMLCKYLALYTRSWAQTIEGMRNKNLARRVFFSKSRNWWTRQLKISLTELFLFTGYRKFHRPVVGVQHLRGGQREDPEEFETGGFRPDCRETRSQAQRPRRHPLRRRG